MNPDILFYDTALPCIEIFFFLFLSLLWGRDMNVSMANFLEIYDLNQLINFVWEDEFLQPGVYSTLVSVIENRIYREELTRKKCKTAILLYCFHTAGVLHIFMLYCLLGPGISFYRKSKIIVKRSTKLWNRLIS